MTDKVNTFGSSRVYHNYSTLKIRIVKEIELMSEEQFSKQPKQGWSVSQVIQHLILTEQISLKYMQKKIQNENLQKVNLLPRIKLRLVDLAFHLNMKFNAPKIVSPESEIETFHNMDKKTLLNKWLALSIEIKEFLKKLPEGLLKKQIYRHPFAGRLNAFDAAYFWAFHIEHHWKQIGKIRKIIEKI